MTKGKIQFIVQQDTGTHYNNSSPSSYSLLCWRGTVRGRSALMFRRSGDLLGVVCFIVVLLLSTASPCLSVWNGRLEVSSQSKISNYSRHVLHVLNKSFMSACNCKGMMAIIIYHVYIQKRNGQYFYLFHF